MAQWHSRYGIPVSAHPHAVGIHPVKSAGDAGGAGYKLVSQSPFKRYAHEDAKLPLRNETVFALKRVLHGDNVKDAEQAARELMRRHKNGRMPTLTVGDFNAIRKYTGYGKPPKQTRKYRQSPDEPTRRRIF